MGLILASGSPRRREILTNAGYEFRVLVSDTDENIDGGLPPGEVVMAIAQEKARAVFDGGAAAGDVVLAADTIVVFEGEILGKPVDAADAARMLRLLSGRTHAVYTGVCILGENKKSAFYVKTDVTFYDFTQGEIEDYIKTGEPFDKAGAYGIQGRGAVLVERIEGDYFNVMGLPVSRTARELKEFLIDD